MKKTILLLLLLITSFIFDQVYAQSKLATLVGKVSDKNGNPIELANVGLINYSIGTTTNKKGEYILGIPAGRPMEVGFTVIGYEIYIITLNLEEDEMKELNVELQIKSEELGEVIVLDREASSGNIVRIDAKAIDNLPDLGIGTVEGIIKTQPGVTSSNELSNQYSVRGGSFDENLVYVNDIEVYRPSLIRSGQQEGLSFVNSDMVSSIEFSAGGFDAKYGDKMSSVLDIKYHRPTEFSASASASFLGGKAHIENISKNGKFTYNMGLRYKTFKYLLSSLNTKGDYNPSFIDYQGYFTYTLSDKFELNFLGTASSNKYQFIPESGKSQSGTFNDKRSITVGYDGQEVDRYKTYTGTFSLKYEPTRNAYLNFNASAFTTYEAESFDVIGYYYLHEVLNEGTAEQEDTSLNIGVGFYHEHGRNYMDARVLSFSHKGGIKGENNFLQWGLKFKQEFINDQMNEWEYRDSAGYSLPFSPSNTQLFYSAKTSNPDHSEQRYTGFIQDSYLFPLGIGEMKLTGGIRAHYWTYTDKLSISPRFSASLNTGVEHDIVTRLSFGVYQQPAFYRELKNIYGIVSPTIQTPKSIHAVAGFDYSFVSWDRPFRLTIETYYKALRNLIPYQVENVRIRYLSDQISNGYAYGADLKVNGEFVSGTQSWISMSLMKTAEDLVDDYRNDGSVVGYIARPSDQRFKFSMFFQDYLPGLPQYQMHLTGHFITGAPYGIPRSQRYQQTARIQSYKRVDIGLMRSIVSNGKNLTKRDFFNLFENFDVSLEVFNVMDIKNVSSYIFVADINNNYYPMPNYLTGITFNLKVSASF